MDEPKKPKKGGFKKALRITLIVVFLIGAAGFGFYNQSDVGQGAAAYPKYQKQYRELGLALTAEEYTGSLAVPAEQNAGEVLKQVTAEKTLKQKRTKWSPPTVVGKIIYFSEQEWDFIKEYIARLDKVSDRPFCIVPHKWNPVDDAFFTETWFVKRAVRGLLFKSEQDLANNRVSEGIHKIWLAARLSTWVQQEGTMTSQLVRCSTTLDVARHISSQLTAHGKDRAFVAGLEPAIRELETPFNLRGTVRGEAFVSAREGAWIQAKSSTFKEAYRNANAEGLRDEDRAMAIAELLPGVRASWSARLLEIGIATSQNCPENDRDLRSWLKMARTVDAIADRPGASYYWARFGSRRWLEDLKVCVRGVVAANVIRQAHSALLYKFEHEKFPTSIPVTGDAGVDLLWEKPLKLDTSKGFKIWSVGPNGVDDNGVRDSKTKKDDFCVNLTN